MNSIVLYFYSNKVGLHKDLQDMAVWNRDEIVGFVRVELHKGKTASQALAAAKPRPNEIVLNAVRLL